MPSTEIPITKLPEVPCPIDEDWLLYEDYCYKVFSEATEESRSWWNSRKYCQENGAELASIHTFDENYWILHEVTHAYNFVSKFSCLEDTFVLSINNIKDSSDIPWTS